MRSRFRPLRSQHVFPTVRNAIAQASRRLPEFRVVHFSVQYDHLHLIVEASNKAALSAGMRGLAIRVARHVNSLISRRGAVWADRWHGRALISPRAVRHALVYVLANFKKHETHSTRLLDPYSSAPYFDGFSEYAGAFPSLTNPDLVPRALAPPRGAPVEPARTWLLRRGWRLHHRISIRDVPRGH